MIDMDAISAYFASNPAAFTMLIVFIALAILYSLIQKMVKFAVIVLFIALIISGIYFFKDPASMPEKIHSTVSMFKDGGGEIADKLQNLWDDTKNLASKAKEVPGDINKLLDSSDEKTGGK